jgi:hypothetical protein
VFIVIFFLLGIVSQLKLWKLVKERRERGAVTRMEREEHQQREEEERGRRIENDFARERAQWEAEYGDKTVARTHDSAIGSSNDSNPKTSVSVKERRSGSVEMVDMSRPKELDSSKLMSRDASKIDGGPVVTVRVMQDDNIQHIDSDGNTLPSPHPGTARNSGFNSTPNSSARGSAEMRPVEEFDEHRVDTGRTSLRASVPPPPIIVPLPFTVPSGEDSDREDRASVSTVPESLPSKRPVSKRFSALSNRLSMNRKSSDHSQSQEVLIPHIEDDRSSVAATVDDMTDDDLSLPELSPPHSPLKQGFEENMNTHIDGTHIGNTDEKDSKDKEGMKSLDVPPEMIPVPPSPGPVEETASKSPYLQSLTTSTDPKSAETKAKRTSIRSRRRSGGASVTNDDDSRARRTSKSMPSIPHSVDSNEESHIGSLAEVLPEKLSKVVLSYRTNEWAKHLEVADKPEQDELQQPPSPGIQIQMSLPEATTPPKVVEKAAPVRVSSPPAPQLARQGSQTNPYRQPNANRSSSTMSRYSMNDSTPNLLSRNPSRVSVNSIPTNQIPGQYSGGPPAVSRSISAAKLRGGRNSSMPLMNQSLIESPIEEEPATRFAPSPVPGNNPMANRQSLTRNYTTPALYTPYASLPNLNVAAASNADSTRATALHSADSDNLSLSERKQLIDQESQRRTLIQNVQPQQRRQGTRPTPADQMQVGDFNSHQPQRTASGLDHGKREARFATWRESIRQETAQPIQPVVSEDDRRLAMIQQRKREEMEKQQQAVAAATRDTMFDNMMRRGDMLDAHREALRRMQASANKNA